MGKLIILRGPAGIGKTTISKELAKEINAEIFHFDKILDELKLGYVYREKWIPLENFLKANKIMLPRFKSMLQNNNLIIEGNFYHKEQIKDLINNLHFPHFIFTLKADLEECIKRDKTREGIGEQRVKAVFKLVSAFDYGITINTNNKSSKEVIKEIISNLSKI